MQVEAKKAVPKEENPGAKQANGLSQRTKKIFVGGLAPSVDEHAFRKYFEQYGVVDDAVVMCVPSPLETPSFISQSPSHHESASAASRCRGALCIGQPCFTDESKSGRELMVSIW